ncbi:plasminogen-like [Branchiostoma floridae]|uniref:Plasminogen-like n=1 Tax=Branchiostoma floridae TaxID=7739 RepID=A0A9J7MAW5_BRAFL|nr:plasminogen-like [Branchiostoma floridae]
MAVTNVPAHLDGLDGTVYKISTSVSGNHAKMDNVRTKLGATNVPAHLDGLDRTANEREDGKGSSYRGKVAVTNSGKKCQRWDRQTPQEHDRTPAEYPSSGLEQNYCRNPDGVDGVWCYTTDPGKRWEYYDVPVCG